MRQRALLHWEYFADSFPPSPLVLDTFSIRGTQSRGAEWMSSVPTLKRCRRPWPRRSDPTHTGMPAELDTPGRAGRCRGLTDLPEQRPACTGPCCTHPDSWGPLGSRPAEEPPRLRRAHCGSTPAGTVTSCRISRSVERELLDGRPARPPRAQPGRIRARQRLR